MSQDSIIMFGKNTFCEVKEIYLSYRQVTYALPDALHVKNSSLVYHKLKISTSVRKPMMMSIAESLQSTVMSSPTKSRIVTVMSNIANS